MLLSVERHVAGAVVVRPAGATLLLRTGLGQAVLPASRNLCRRTIGVPQELARSCRLLGDIPEGGTGLPTPGFDGALVRRGAKTTSATEVPPTKRSAVGWAAGRHSVLIVPVKLANSPPLEPVEGSETSSHGTVTEKHDECLEIRQSCPRNRNG